MMAVEVAGGDGDGGDGQGMAHLGRWLGREREVAVVVVMAVTSRPAQRCWRATRGTACGWLEAAAVTVGVRVPSGQVP